MVADCRKSTFETTARRPSIAASASVVDPMDGITFMISVSVMVLIVEPIERRDRGHDVMNTIARPHHVGMETHCKIAGIILEIRRKPGSESLQMTETAERKS